MNNDYQNTRNDMELEAMRQQMNTLKKKLDQQEIVNDRIIRHSMERTANKINRRYYAIMALCLLMIPYSYWAFVKLNSFSVPFWIYTCIVMLVCLGGTYYNSRNLDLDMMTNSLVDVRRYMARAKKFDANWLFVGIPFAIVFLGILSASSKCLFQRPFLGRMYRRRYWSHLGTLSPL